MNTEQLYPIWAGVFMLGSILLARTSFGFWRGLGKAVLATLSVAIPLGLILVLVKMIKFFWYF